jgi:hypothetical protein
VHYGVPAVTKCYPFEKGVLNISVHVSEQSDALMAFSTVELDRDSVLLVINIGRVEQATPAPLSIAARQTVRPFHLIQLSHLQRRLGTGGYVAQDVGQTAGDACSGCVHSLPRAVDEGG